MAAGSILIACTTLWASNDILNELSGSTGLSPMYVNECPGAQGERQSQAVGCFSIIFGQTVVAGCCYGGENCSVTDPCGNGASFQCGKWCKPNGFDDGRENGIQ